MPSEAKRAKGKGCICSAVGDFIIIWVFSYPSGKQDMQSIHLSWNYFCLRKKKIAVERTVEAFFSKDLFSPHQVKLGADS